MKETFESIVIAFILAFVFRAFVVEAFVIPTGSMAPTLLGQHLPVRCDQCGYRFKVDVADREGGGHAALRLRQNSNAVCPMCHFPNLLKAGMRPRAGDRILVHKYIYEFSKPQRWDVLVFKNPSDPNQNYIKRLVGLPGERLLIIEGNVYVKPLNADHSLPWRIVRKTDPSANYDAAEIQRVLWQPIYDSAYVPLDQGRNGRRRPLDYGWSSPWVQEQGQWEIEQRRSYRYDSADAGAIRCELQPQTRHGATFYCYNQLKRNAIVQHPLEELRIAARVQPDHEGLSICIKTIARLDQTGIDPQPLTVVGRIDATGQAVLETTESGARQKTRILDRRVVVPFKAGRSTTVELWYVDQEVSMWMDGERVLQWQFDMEMSHLMKRRPLPAGWYPQVAIEVSGTPVTLHRVMVDRDMEYVTFHPQDMGQIARGALSKRGGRIGNSEILDIQPGQYFCLGDNSPLSHDGRFWKANEVDPWVKKTMLADPDYGGGVVPDELIIGKAFFVYFPASYAVAGTKIGLIPNFGEMRFIH